MRSFLLADVFVFLSPQRAGYCPPSSSPPSAVKFFLSPIEANGPTPYDLHCALSLLFPLWCLFPLSLFFLPKINRGGFSFPFPSSLENSACGSSRNFDSFFFPPPFFFPHNLFVCLFGLSLLSAILVISSFSFFSVNKRSGMFPPLLPTVLPLFFPLFFLCFSRVHHRHFLFLFPSAKGKSPPPLLPLRWETIAHSPLLTLNAHHPFFQ